MEPPNVNGYRVERVLSTKPGVHAVVEAEAADGSRVAITLLDSAPAEDRRLRQQILHLAEIRESIRHQNVVPLLQVLRLDGRVGLVSQPAGPGTLGDRLESGPLDPGEAVALLAQVAGALDTAAAHGLVHRDLGPKSVLLGDRPLLGDFGITLPPLRGCELAEVAEGVDCFSPEEVWGEPLTPESNVYSLACILVECLTGAPPFPYDRPLLTMHAHVVEPPPRVSARRPELPAELDGVIVRAMAKDPRDRFSSAGAFMRAAGEALEVEVTVPVLVPVPPADPVPARPRPRPRRGARRVALALVAAGVCGLTVGLVDWSAAPAREPTERPSGERVQLVERQRAVNDAVDELSERRAAIRDRLRHAARPAGQAAAANALADAYEEARRTLYGNDAVERRDVPIRDGLREAERSYKRLAAAARRRDRREWSDARRQTRRHEADLESALG